MDKLVGYIEKRIQECERFLPTRKGKDLSFMQGEIKALKTTLKYVKGGRWMDQKGSK